MQCLLTLWTLMEASNFQGMLYAEMIINVGMYG